MDLDVNHAMLSLPSVTLLIFNPAHGADLSARVLSFVCRHIQFGDVVHLADAPPSVPCPGRHVSIPRVDYTEGQRWQAYELGRYFDTPHMMHVETDGFPFHFHLWDNAFLEYDYVGAPWPLGCRHYGQGPVGNGGFSLQSKKFRNVLWNHRHLYELGYPSDVFFVNPAMLAAHQAAGVRIAPVDIAIRFSYENPVPEFPTWCHQQSFGFHGRFPACQAMIDQALT